LRVDGTARALRTTEQGGEEVMLSINIDNIGDLAVVECEGRIVRSEAAFKLRDAVISQNNARILVLDLSEVYAIEGGGLGMLAFLQRWACDHDIRFKLFNPSNPCGSGWSTSARCQSSTLLRSTKRSWPCRQAALAA